MTNVTAISGTGGYSELPLIPPAPQHAHQAHRLLKVFTLAVKLLIDNRPHPSGKPCKSEEFKAFGPIANRARLGKIAAKTLVFFLPLTGHMMCLGCIVQVHP